MITLRAINNNGLVVDLDVIESNQPLRLDISAIENASIGELFGISSQTFSLPGTDKNNQFFGNLFDLGANPSVALQNSIDCQLLTDGQEVFKGKLYINDIITDQKGYTTYQVNLVNESVDFKFQLGEKLVSELDFSAFNHSYTYGAITSSWSGSIAGGDIVYPHINYGKPEGDNSAPEWSFSNNFSGTGFDIIGLNTSKPLRVIDFKPAIRAKSVLDTIFDSIDYKYESDFFTSSYFNNLYVVTTPSDQLGVNNTDPTTGSFWAYKSGTNQSFNALTQTKITFQNEVYDTLDDYNTSTSVYTAYATGRYIFNLRFQFDISNYDIENRLRFNVALKTNSGTVIKATRLYVNPPENGSLIVPFNNVNLTVGDQVEVFMELISTDGSEVVTLGQGQNNTFFKLASGPSSQFGVNQNVNMAKQFPTDLKCFDFLQGLIEKFNLVVEPIPGERNLLRIEPFQDWIDSGEVKDWTDKVDRSVRFQISHPISEQPNTIIFRDADDEAAPNKYTVDNFGDTYGTYIYKNESDLAQGTREVGKVFAATPVKNIPLSTNFIIPTLARKEPGEQPRPFKFKPRLLYANGLKSVGVEAMGHSFGIDTNIPRGWIKGRYFFRDENGTDHALTQFYQMTPYEELPADFESTKDLHFGNNKLPGWYPYFQSTGINGKVSNSAYHLYWETYINSLYDIDARKLVCNIFLKPSEIQDIALNDKIFIDGHYYRINSINGANITEDDSVEVSLIKQLNNKLVYPRRRVTVGNTTVDLQVKSEDLNGKVIYQDYDGGQVIQDFGFISQVALKDGYQVFEVGSTGSVAWDTLPQVDIALDKTVIGNNDVSSEAGRISVVGQSNTIKDQVTEANVIGTNNSIGESTDTTFVTGFNNFIDVDQSNNFAIASLNGVISSSTDNSGILGGTGSAIYNGDWVQIINGNIAAARDSDFTTLINPHLNEVVINGSGHAVIGLNKEGGGLDLLEYRQNSNYLGDTYMGGAQFIELKTIQCGDTVTVNLYDTQYQHDSLFVLNWSGFSPGTTTINLPNLTNNDYKKIHYRIKANSTFDGTTLVKLVPFTSPQSVQGLPSASLSASYDYIELFASGSEWLILNGGSSAVSASFPSTASYALFAATASYIDPLFISASAAASGFGSGNSSVSASYALFAVTASCANNIKTTNYDQPESNIYYYTQVPSTGSQCKEVSTLDVIGLRYNANTNTHIIHSDLFVSGTFSAQTISGAISSSQQITDLGFINKTQTSSMSVLNSVTASYINPTFISASAAAAGFGSGGGDSFPYTGSAVISGSLTVTGSSKFDRPIYIRNVPFGLSSELAASSNSDIAIGPAALGNLSAVDKRNVAIGYSASAGNTTGATNVAIGYESLKSNQTTSGHTIVGVYSGRSITSANGLTTLGQGTLYSTTQAGTGDTYIGLSTGFNLDYTAESTVIGSNAYTNGRSSQDVVIGRLAMVGVSSFTGSQNVVIGYNSTNDSYTSVSGSVLIGAYSSPQSTTSSNEIVIGARAQGNGDYTVTLGSDAITDTYLKGKVHASNGFYGDGSNLTGITALPSPSIASGSVTASVSPNNGFIVKSSTLGSQFTGSVNVSGSVTATSFAGDGSGLTHIPQIGTLQFFDNNTFLFNLPGDTTATPVDIHISQSGVYFISCSGVPAGVAGPRVNFYWWTELLNNGDSVRLKFELPNGDGLAGVTYRNNVTGSASNEWYWYSSTASPASLANTTITRNTTYPQISPGSGVSSVVKDENGKVFFTNANLGASGNYYKYTGESKAPLV
jgi:hypothetical protein